MSITLSLQIVFFRIILGGHASFGYFKIGRNELAHEVLVLIASVTSRQFT